MKFLSCLFNSKIILFLFSSHQAIKLEVMLSQDFEIIFKRSHLIEISKRSLDLFIIIFHFLSLVSIFAFKKMSTSSSFDMIEYFAFQRFDLIFNEVKFTYLLIISLSFIFGSLEFTL